MQYACVILPSVPCPALQYFPTLSHKRHDFWEKATEHKMCVLIFSTTCVWNISHSKKNWARYDQNCISVCMKSTGYCWQIVMKLELYRQVLEEIPAYQILRKSIQWEPSCSMRTDGRTRRSWYLHEIRLNAPKDFRGWVYVLTYNFGKLHSVTCCCHTSMETPSEWA
jgi:hypothetical protein